MDEKEKTYKLIGCCLEVHKTLGAGYLEAVYQEALGLEFATAGIPFEREKAIAIQYKGNLLEKKYFADFVCYGNIIVETKAVSMITAEHYSQVINYLKGTGFELGLLVNFGTASMQWKRIVLTRGKSAEASTNRTAGEDR